MWLTTVGGGPCRTCGLEGQVVATPTRWARLRGWLFDGQAPSSTLRCPNGHEWPAGSSASLWVSANRGPAWWSWPTQVMRVLIQHRTAEPVPVFWLGATVVGVMLGVVLRVTLDWSWLLVTVGWLVLVWLFFLATALLREGRHGLWIDLVRTVSPTRAERLETEELSRMVQAAPGPVYGLAGWAGQRSLGGHGQSGSMLIHLELMYGDPAHGPHLRVNTIWRRLERLVDAEQDHIRRELTRELWYRQVPRPEDLAPEEFHQWAMKRRIDIDERPVPKWAKSEFLIDDISHPAETSTVGDDWVAVIDLDSALIGLQSCGIPTNRVALTQVSDIAPYAEGSRQLRGRHLNRRP
jgi:hypothetical protein